MNNLQIYFYKNKFPKKHDLVYGKIIDVLDCGINIILPEYGNIQGMLIIDEVSSNGKCNLTKKYKVGNSIICRVSNIDSNKGFIDLTKDNIFSNDKEYFYKIYKYNKAIIGLLNEYLKQKKEIININVFLEKTLWKLKTKNYLKELKKSDFDCSSFNINDNKEFEIFLKDKINPKQA